MANVSFLTTSFVSKHVIEKVFTRMIVWQGPKQISKLKFIIILRENCHYFHYKTSFLLIMTISVAPFGKIKQKDGRAKEILQYTLSSKNMVLQVINYGATITSLKVLDKRGSLVDIVLGFDNIEAYVNHPYYFGCTVGRYANRIARGQFSLNNETYSLAVNSPPHHLHGGWKGFDKAIWNVLEDHSETNYIQENKIEFTYCSFSEEENYPSTLNCSVVCEITDDNTLIISYKATASSPTPINLTNHSYFNLAGHDFGSIEDHSISLCANYYTPVDGTGIPTGVIQPVDSTVFDLRKEQTFKKLFKSLPDGFDHNFCINGAEHEKKVASVHHPESGISMEVSSTQPGVQLYTANFLPEDNSLLGKGKACYKKHGAFCLETQNYPNAINQVNFPKAYITAGELYEHSTKFSFKVL